MRFLMMIKGDEQSEAGMLPDEKLFEAMTRYNQELVDAGALLAAEGLQPSSKGARVRLHRRRTTVTDGPFSEAKELVAGFWLIQADSKEEAIAWAKRIPFEAGETAANRGGAGQVEVRPLFDAEALPITLDRAGSEQGAGGDMVAGAAAQAQPGGKQFMILRKIAPEAEAEAMPSSEVFATLAALRDEMRQADVLLLNAGGLRPSAQGFRLTYSGGKRTVIDGPFTEAKELIAGFALMQAKSLEEAVEWVKRWPAQDAKGEVELEVRQVFAADDLPLSPALKAIEDRQRARIAGKL